jgi:ABC transport system ATP-binding/permease protein
MILLSCENITKSYTDKILLNEISLFLNERDKIGVIGANGAGKTTFLKIIAGIVKCDSGTISKNAGTNIGYLEQSPEFKNNCTIIEAVFEGVSPHFVDLRGFEAKTILTKLGMSDFNKSVNNLSGGEKKRVAIARTLVNPCDILILDEPTNHLDNDMVVWLENYLKKYNGAMIMITHDRYFLDRVTNKIIEIEKGNLYSYETNYSGYLDLKARRLEDEMATARKNKTLLRKEKEWMMRGPRGRGTKSKSRKERFEELSSKGVTHENSKLEINSVSTRLGKKTIEINNISKGFDGKILIKDFTHIFLKTSRIGIVGANGAGKSTLLKMIAKEVLPDTGSIDIGSTVKIGYFKQQCEDMDQDLKVIDYIKNVAEYVKTVDGEMSASQMLELFLFPPDLQYNKIKRLSGGERRRLFLLKILIDAPNILLLDEPTNDLDIQALEVLEFYLEYFSGVVIVVSHDRYFLDNVANEIFELDNGYIKKYNGNYSDYVQKVFDDSQNIDTVKPQIKIQKKEQVKKDTKVKFTYKEKIEFENIDTEIFNIETEISLIDTEIECQASDYEKLNELVELKVKKQEQLALKMDRWLYLNDMAEKIER